MVIVRASGVPAASVRDVSEPSVVMRIERRDVVEVGRARQEAVGIVASLRGQAASDARLVDRRILGHAVQCLSCIDARREQRIGHGRAATVAVGHRISLRSATPLRRQAAAAGVVCKRGEAVIVLVDDASQVVRQIRTGGAVLLVVRKYGPRCCRSCPDK